MSKLTYIGSRKENPLDFPRNSGMSESASRILKESDALREKFGRSISFGEHLSKVIEELLQAKQKYSLNNWDGYGAESINEQSYENALRLALSLPANIPIPDVYVRPSDGNVVFEWYEGKRLVFSIAIGIRNELYYAGLYGVIKTCGVEYVYDSIPVNIIDNIKRLYL